LICRMLPLAVFYIRRLSQGVPDDWVLSAFSCVPDATSVVKMELMMFGGRNRGIPKEMGTEFSNRLHNFVH